MKKFLLLNGWRYCYELLFIIKFGPLRVLWFVHFIIMNLNRLVSTGFRRRQNFTYVESKPSIYVRFFSNSAIMSASYRPLIFSWDFLGKWTRFQPIRNKPLRSSIKITHGTLAEKSHEIIVQMFSGHSLIKFSLLNSKYSESRYNIFEVEWRLCW